MRSVFLSMGEKDKARFWSFVHQEPLTGCWLWSGTLAYKGGKPSGAHITIRGHPVMAHTVAWLLEKGPLPEAAQLRRCSAMGVCCVNPEHFRPRPINTGVLTPPHSEAALMEEPSVVLELGPSARERFLSRVHEEPNTGCFLWEGSSAWREGKAIAGHMHLGDRPVSVTHIAWVLAHGSIPGGHRVLRCSTMGAVCVNVEHLRLEEHGNAARALEERPGDSERRRGRQALCVEACKGIPTAVLAYLAEHGVGVAELLPWPVEAPLEEQLHAARILVQARAKAREMAEQAPASTRGTLYAQAIRRWMDAHMTADKPWGWTALGKRELERCLDLLEEDYAHRLQAMKARAFAARERELALGERVESLLIQLRAWGKGLQVAGPAAEAELGAILECFNTGPHPGVGCRETLLAEAEANLEADEGLTPADRERLRHHLRAGFRPAAAESPPAPAR
jgi:hypothetical protein